jgi:hypothetical protein
MRERGPEKLGLSEAVADGVLALFQNFRLDGGDQV